MADSVKIKCEANRWVLAQKKAYSGYFSKTTATGFKYTTVSPGDPQPSVNDSSISLFATDRREYVEKKDPYDWYIMADADDYIRAEFDINPILRPGGNAKVGDVSGGNYFEIEPDGTDIRHGKATAYDDLRFPAIANRLDVTRGNIDYNYTDLTLDFNDTAIYPDDPLGMIAQMQHNKKLGTALCPHIHWIQSSANVPNWLLKYRWVDNGQTPTAWVNIAATEEVFTYSSGDLIQITKFPDIEVTGNENVSSIIQVKLFRDTTNASTLFSGADPLTGNAALIEFDFHYQLDMLGSREEYVK